jgi:hypothetical protein
MFRWLILVTYCLVLTTSLTAQNTNEPCQVCWHAQPKDSCDVIILTDFGFYWLFPPTDRARLRLVADYGVLVNVSELDAVGATFFASIGSEFHIGPEIRYRHWLGANNSIDFGFGLPIEKSYDGSWVASPYGLVKWNPIHWFGLALRMELRRPSQWDLDYNPDKSTQFYMSAGVEFGELPGAIMTPVVPGIFFIIIGLWLGGLGV